MSDLFRTSLSSFFLVIFSFLLCNPKAFALSDLLVTSNQTLTTGTFAYDDVIVSSNANLFIDGDVHISATNITINAGSTISGNEKGYAALQGPGAGQNSPSGGSGAGHGGNGGAQLVLPDAGDYYGSATVPLEMGSGGGGASCTQNGQTVNSGGAGGAAISLDVSNTLTVNGTLSVDGADGSVFICDAQSGGGAGGSIYITTSTLAGSGAISANGGDGGMTLLRGGGGGGGRIAIYYDVSTYTGVTSAYGGEGLFELTGGEGDDGTIGFFDVDDNIFVSGHEWRFQVDDDPFVFDSIEINGNAFVTSEGTLSITGTNLVLDGSSQLVLSGAEVLSLKDILVQGNSSIKGNLVTSVNNLTIDSGSIVSADGKGFEGEKGLGAGLPNGGFGGGGGGYGGDGGTSLGGLAYGSATAPVDMGSGGAGPGFSSDGVVFASSGGTGGGKIQLTIADTFTVNGTLSSNGNDAYPQGTQAGGGSGGSIYVITEKFTGLGSITANGGESGPQAGSAAGGGGSGGRIAIYHRQTATFTGITAVDGGLGVGGNGDDGSSIVTQNQVAISPEQGGDSGFVTVTISGIAISEEVSVKLKRSGQADIMGTVVKIEESLTSMQVEFDLDGKTLGSWDLEIDNGGATPVITSNNAFTIVDGEVAKIVVRIVGRTEIRANRAQKYYINYSNISNVDSDGTVVIITGLPKVGTIRTNFGYIVSPLDLPINVSDNILSYYDTADSRNIKFRLLSVPAGYSGALVMELTVPPATNFTIQPVVLNP